MARSAAKAKTTRKAADRSGDAAPLVDDDLLLEFYRRMLLVRRFEEKVGQMYGMGLIGGFCHLYIGQEATGASVLATAARRLKQHFLTPSGIASNMG